VPPKAIVATALVFAIHLGTSTSQVFAQAGSHESPQTSSADPSELAPARSTWKGAFTDSLRLLLVEHTTRVAFQGKTRRELSGNFFSDYKRSVRMPDTWDDGDSWAVNYIGHPIHGAASGFIWLDHEDGSHDPKLGFSSTGPAEDARLGGLRCTASSSNSVYSARRPLVTSACSPTPPAGLITSSRPRAHLGSWSLKMRSIDISLSASSPGPVIVWSEPSHGRS